MQEFGPALRVHPVVRQDRFEVRSASVDPIIQLSQYGETPGYSLRLAVHLKALAGAKRALRGSGVPKDQIWSAPDGLRISRPPTGGSAQRLCRTSADRKPSAQIIVCATDCCRRQPSTRKDHTSSPA